MSTTPETQQTTTMSIGTGIAIAGIWLAATLVTLGVLAFLLIAILNSDPATDISNSSGAGYGMLILLAGPLIAAWTITAKILNKN